MFFQLSRPTPFFIHDEKFKKKMEKISEEWLYRMKKEDEPLFFAYLNALVKVREEW